MKLLGKYTAKGLELSRKLQTGAALQITRATAGDGRTPSSATVLEHDCEQLAVNPPQRSGEQVTLRATLAEPLVEQGFTLREVGVYAQDPDEGELLYRIFRTDEEITVEAGGRNTYRFTLEETVSEAAEVAVVGSATGLLTEGDLEILRGAPNGLATLDTEGTVPPAQMPYSYGTEDLEAGVTPLETGKLYFVYE